jgi:hypothetical protein
MCAPFSPRSLSMSCRISTPSNRASTVKSISLRRCATYPLIVFLSSAGGSIIWVGKRSPRSCTAETSPDQSVHHAGTDESKHPPTMMTGRGYNVLAWRNDGMKYWPLRI